MTSAEDVTQPPGSPSDQTASTHAAHVYSPPAAHPGVPGWPPPMWPHPPVPPHLLYHPHPHAPPMYLPPGWPPAMPVHHFPGPHGHPWGPGSPPPRPAWHAPPPHLQREVQQGSPPTSWRPPRPPLLGSPPRPRALAKRSSEELASSTPPEAGCVQINNHITACTSRTAVLRIIQQALPSFDAVCMATAAHKMGTLPSEPGPPLAKHPAILDLARAIEANSSNFLARNISNACYGFAKMGFNPVQPGCSMMEALAAEAVVKLPGFIPQNFGNLLWAWGVLGFRPENAHLEALLVGIEKKLPSLSAQHISNIVMALGKMEFPAPSFLAAVAAEAKPKLGQFNPQALSNTVWGFAKLEHLDSGFMQSITATILTHNCIQGFNAQNLANTVWGMATLGFMPGKAFMTAVADAAIRAIPDLNPQNLSYGKLGHTHEALIAALDQRTLQLLPQLQPQSVANCLWAHATLQQRPSEAYLAAVAKHVRSCLPAFTPQHISNSVWALASCAYHDQALMAAVTSEVRARLGDPHSSALFSRQHLSNLAWSYATLEAEPRPELMSILASALVQRISDCNPQELSNTIWAFAKLRVYNVQLVEAIIQEAALHLQDFSQQNLANMAWALAKQGHQDKAIMAGIAQRMRALAPELSLQHISNVLWAFASLALLDSHTMPEVIHQAESRLGAQAFNAQQLSNLLWALAISQLCTGTFWDRTLQQLHVLQKQGSLGEDSPGAPDTAHSKQLAQVYQACLLLKLQEPQHAVDSDDSIVAAARATWTASASKVTVSHLQADVGASLAELGEHMVQEYPTEDALFSIDLALPGESIAIEVDGPHHFTANTKQPTGESQARQRLLAARGWHIISLPFFVWSSASRPQRLGLLKQVLAGVREQIKLQQAGAESVATGSITVATKSESQAAQ